MNADFPLRFYKSGILSSADLCRSNPPFDHAIMLVGYAIETITIIGPPTTKTVCKWAKASEKKDKLCKNPDSVYDEIKKTCCATIIIKPGVPTVV